MGLIKELSPHMKRVLEDLDHTELARTLELPCQPAPAGNDHGLPPCGTH